MEGHPGRRRAASSRRWSSSSRRRAGLRDRRRGDGRRDGRLGLRRPVRRTAGAAHPGRLPAGAGRGGAPAELGAGRCRRRTSTASSPGRTSARRRAPASSTSPPAAARRTSSSARRRACRRSRRWTNAASSCPASAGWTGKSAVDPATTDWILDDLKKKGRLFAAEMYPHSYPHCWRCKTELLFRLVDEWFIDMTWRDEIMDVTRAGDVPAGVDQRPGPRAGLAEQHGRLDDLQEALLGPGPADLGGREDRRFRGDRLARGAEGARRRGLGGVRRATRRTGRGSTR